MKPLIRKSWYTLTEAADYLTQSTEGGPVTVSDLLQLAVEGEIILSLNLFSILPAESGRIVWASDQTPEGITVDDIEDFVVYPGESCNSADIDLTNAEPIVSQDWPLYFLPDNQGTIANNGTYWELTGYGWGEQLLRTLWRESYKQQSRPIDSVGALSADRGYQSGSKITALGMDLTLKNPQRELFLSFQPENSAPLVIKVLWDLLPDETMIGITREELDNLLTDNTAASDQPESETEATELRRTQRTLAALAIGLAKKHRTYSHGKKASVNALAETATDHLRDANGRTPHGFSDRTARDAIAAALKACPDLTNEPDKAG